MSERPFSDRSYRQFLDEDKLMGSRCRACGELFAPPRPICSHCSAAEMDWETLSGRGTLAAFTCIALGPPSMVEEGYDREHPYCVGVVDLVEGVRVDARIQGVDASRPESILVDTPLTVSFLRRGEGDAARTLLAFTPAAPLADGEEEATSPDA